MLHAGRDEQEVAGAERDARTVAHERARAGGDDVDLVAGVRRLPVVAARGVELDVECAVAEDGGEARAAGAGDGAEPVADGDVPVGGGHGGGG